MSEPQSLSTEFVHNPLAPTPNGGTPVMRLTVQPVDVEQVHPDVPVPKRFDVGIESGVAHDGASIEELECHSHHMTADVMDLGEGQAGLLSEEQVELLFEQFKDGRFKKPYVVPALD